MQIQSLPGEPGLATIGYLEIMLPQMGTNFTEYQDPDRHASEFASRSDTRRFSLQKGGGIFRHPFFVFSK